MGGLIFFLFLAFLMCIFAKADCASTQNTSSTTVPKPPVNAKNMSGTTVSNPPANVEIKTAVETVSYTIVPCEKVAVNATNTAASHTIDPRAKSFFDFIGKPMEVSGLTAVSTKVFDREDYYAVWVYYNNNIQLDSVIAFIRAYEDENTQMLCARCETYEDHIYDDFSTPIRRKCYTVEEIIEFEKFSNPGESYDVEFGSRENHMYQFDFSATGNTHEITFSINKKRANAPQDPCVKS